eukprot:scaffold2992_cov214-Amphora_coffeaeformis.AAC.27
MGTPCPLLEALIEYSLCLESLVDILLNQSAERTAMNLGYGAPTSAILQAYSTAVSTNVTSLSRPFVHGAAGSPSSPQVHALSNPMQITGNSKTVPPARLGRIDYCMPTTLIGTDRVAGDAYVLGPPPRPEDECAEVEKRKTACPVCLTPFEKKTPVGHLPSGSMMVSHDPFRTCAGHTQGSLVIHYCLIGGVQQLYHPNPGERYFPTSRIAYIPDTEDGIRLLSRLQDAFRHGLTFAVGTSLTTGRSNMVCWQSIPHKTSPAGGAHGFPYGNYFRNCNEAPTALHVKPAGSDELLQSTVERSSELSKCIGNAHGDGMRCNDVVFEVGKEIHERWVMCRQSETTVIIIFAPHGRCFVGTPFGPEASVRGGSKDFGWRRRRVL